MNGPAPAAAAARFFSLKWKLLALVSLALAAIHVALVLQGYQDAASQFEARQALEFEARVSVLEKLLVQSELRLQRIAAIVPNVLSAATLRPAAVEEQWAAVQLELQLEVMQLYGADGRLRAGGIAGWGAAPPEPVQAHFARALRSERPLGFILCHPGCAQYALVPALGRGGERLLMLLGTSLADVMLEYPGLSRGALALLIEQPGGAYWGGYRVAALSDAPSNEPKLRALSETATLPQLEQGRGLRFGGRHYRFSARPLSAFGGVTPGYFLIFDDTTEALADIRSQLLRQLGAGLTALLAALAVLLSLMSRPMNQLHRLAEALPLLARKQHEAARRMIGTPDARKRRVSEIEVLQAAALDLSRQLEELEQTVAAHSDGMAGMVAELRRAIELNDKILATAPVVILLLSPDGRLMQINEFGTQLLGYSRSEACGLAFAKLLAEPRQRDEATLALVDIVSGRRSLFEQTSPVRCVDGGVERISWLHTRIDAQSGVFVLSVGLPDKSQEPASGAR